MSYYIMERPRRRGATTPSPENPPRGPPPANPRHPEATCATEIDPTVNPSLSRGRWKASRRGSGQTGSSQKCRDSP